jgi:transposase
MLRGRKRHFLPVEIEPSDTPPAPEPVSACGTGASGWRIGIELNDGHRISVEGGFNPDVLARLLKGLMA